MTWQIYLFVDVLPDFWIQILYFSQFLCVLTCLSVDFYLRAAVLARALLEKDIFNLNEAFPG